MLRRPPWRADARTLILGDHRISVAEVLDAWLAPDYRYFKLKGADGDTYLVRHDERSNTWELTMFERNALADDGMGRASVPPRAFGFVHNAANLAKKVKDT